MALYNQQLLIILVGKIILSPNRNKMIELLHKTNVIYLAGWSVQCI